MPENVGQLPPIPFRDVIKKKLRPEVPADAHLGLAFDRYAPIWVFDDKGGWKVETRALGAMANAFQAARARLADALVIHHDRFGRMVEAGGGLSCDFRSLSRLALGLGADHPSENGLTLDPTLGVPYLPGSSLKGLCRAWARLTGMSEKQEIALFGRIQESSNDGDRSGSLVFLDAHPVRPPRLEVDIVNCHLPTYYQRMEKSERPVSPDLALPTDNPVPVSFLTVAPDTVFRLYLMSRAPDPEKRDKEVRIGFGLLVDALRTLGVGAKTAAGYGVFRPEKESVVVVWLNARGVLETKRVRQEVRKRLGQLTEIYLRPGGKSGSGRGHRGGTPWGTLDTLIKDIEKRLPPPERIVVYGDADPADFCYLGYRLAGLKRYVDVVEEDGDGPWRWVAFGPELKELEEKDGEKGEVSDIPNGKSTAAGDSPNSYLALCVTGPGLEPDLDLLIALADHTGGELDDITSLTVDPAEVTQEGGAAVSTLHAFFSHELDKADPSTGFLVWVNTSDALAVAAGWALHQVLERRAGVPVWMVHPEDTGNGFRLA